MIKLIAKKGFVCGDVLLQRTSRAEGETPVFLPLELAAVEEKGFEDTPSLKSRQEGNLFYRLKFLFIFMCFN